MNDNVIHYIWSDITWGERPSNKGWVDRRFDIFKDYVLGNFKMRNGCERTKWVLKIAPQFTYAIEKFNQLKDDVIIHITNPDEHPMATKGMIEEAKRYDWVYYTRCDTDDVFGLNACERIMACKPDVDKALIFQNGFNYNIHSGGFGIWGSRYQPNATIIFPTDYFVDRDKAMDYGVCKHLGIKDKFPKKDFMGNDCYCILIHPDNTSTTPSGSKQVKPAHIRVFKANFPALKDNFEINREGK